MLQEDRKLHLLRRHVGTLIAALMYTLVYGKLNTYFRFVDMICSLPFKYWQEYLTRKWSLTD
jgi:hypothetical protein